MKKTTIITIACAALQACGSGCGGGSSGDNKPAPIVATPARGCAARVVTVPLVGDSTMFGWLTASQSQAVDNPGARLQQDMDAKFGAGTVVVKNYALSGTTSPQAPKITGDVIVANYGINDARLNVPMDVYVAAMKAIGATLIETPNPTWGTAYGAINDSPYADSGRALGLPVADTNAWMLAQPDWQAMLPDGVHPDNAGYRDIVDNVLAPAVAKQVAAILHCTS